MERLTAEIIVISGKYQNITFKYQQALY